mgnify:CR=1 FL=1|jgi:hypothetical protein
MEIFEKRGKWCFRDQRGKLRKFDSAEEAVQAGGLVNIDIPLPEVREYDSLEEAAEAEDVELSFLEN